MELDELKASWQRLDHRVQELTAINRRLMMDNTVRKARWRLAPWIAGAVANVGFGLFFAVASANFWSSHLDSPAALIGGIATHVLSILFIVIGVGRLALARQVDFTRPVLEIQRSLASMQKWEAWSFHAAWLGICLLMVAFMFAFAVGLAGLGFWHWDWERIPGYFFFNLLLWLVAAVGPLLLYFWSRRRNGRFAARMDAFLTSHSIARARATLDELDEFAR
jgi:hypothetical protein